MINDDIIKRKNFWDSMHIEKNVSALSGCQYVETIEFLGVNKLLVPKMHVLEVGVGLGYVTKGFHENGFLICGLDISDVALERVKKYCEHTYSAEKFEELPSNYFDVIICHNLIQHIPTDLLIVELTHIMRSLKDDGIFAVEFVSSKLGDDTGINVEYDGNHVGRYCRTPACLEELINNLGGKCEMVINNQVYNSEITGCHVFHVRK
jgi:ubiquinone/menaquinone biosynthesis C-methylase UbiE